MPRALAFLGPQYARTRVRDLWTMDRHDVPEKGGVYVLLTSDGTAFPYPGGSSRVFYIGQSSNLRRRLQRHLRAIHEIHGERRHTLYYRSSEYAAQFGCRYVCIPRLPRETPKSLEEDVLGLFGTRFRSWPVANSAGAWAHLS